MGMNERIKLRKQKQSLEGVLEKIAFEKCVGVGDSQQRDWY